jgi:hypothetical protein
MIDRENRSKVTEGPVPEDGRPRDRSKVTEGPVPEDGRPREQVQNHRRACPQVLFLRKAELGFFQFLELITGWLVPSVGQKIPLQPGWYLPPQKILLAENRFLQAGKGAENTKEKSRWCFTYRRRFWI